jgi:hypothetical protein
MRFGPLRSGPFGALGRGGKSLVFWRGRRGHLWFAAQKTGSAWTRPHDLGGKVS